MTAPRPPLPPAAKLNFSLLSTGWRVLSTSPAWPEVEAALRRLAARGGAAPDASDSALIHQYAELLRREADTIGRALVVAAGLGALLRDDIQLRRIHRGLDALSEGFHFAQLGPTQVREVLRQVRAELRALYGLPLADVSYDLRDSPPDGAWLARIRAEIGSLEARSRAAIDEGRVAAAGWGDWAARLFDQGWLSGSPRRQPSVPVLICRAAAIGPGPWLRLDPAAMTIREWSRLLLGGLRISADASFDPPPEWTVPAASVVLGFPALDPAAVRSAEPPGKQAASPSPSPPLPRATAELERWVRHPSRSVRAAAIVVTSPPDSPTNDWQPIPGLAALVVDGNDLVGLLAAAPGFPALAAGASPSFHLVVEVGPDEDTPPALERVLAGPLSSYPRLDLLPEEPRRERPRPFVVAPKNADDLLKGLLVRGQPPTA